MQVDRFDAGSDDQRYGGLVSPFGGVCESVTELEVFFEKFSEKGFGPVFWCRASTGW